MAFMMKYIDSNLWIISWRELIHMTRQFRVLPIPTAAISSITNQQTLRKINHKIKWQAACIARIRSLSKAHKSQNLLEVVDALCA